MWCSNYLHLKEHITQAHNIREDPKKFKFFTGLSTDSFDCLVTFLGDTVNRLRYCGRKTKFVTETPSKRRGRSRKLSPNDQLFLTLIKLRRGYTNKDLSYFFELSTGYISTIVITWVQHLYKMFYHLREEMFPPREKYRPLLMKAFWKFKNIMTVIDCTEIFICTDAQNISKAGEYLLIILANHTFKVLVGMSPIGSVSYISDAYEGAILDKEVFLQSGIMDLLNPGDLVLTDRVFTLHSELNAIGVNLKNHHFYVEETVLHHRRKYLQKNCKNTNIFTACVCYWLPCKFWKT